MNGRTTDVAFGMTVLGLVATTILFLGFAAAGVNFLDSADTRSRQERQSAVQAEESQLRDLREQIELLRAERTTEPNRDLASERDVSNLRQQIAAETDRGGALRRDLANARRVPVGLLYGAAQPEKTVQFVECVDGAAIVRPRGTRFSTADMAGLASALSPGHVELLVRPGGFKAFAAVWSALMQLPGMRLGYLPVERDWQLDFGGGA
jgi:hypothetical protein